MSTVAPGVASPCTNVCRMDEESGLCLGCWRSIDEIAGWSRADDAARREILARVGQRRAGRTPDDDQGPGGK